MEVMGVAPRLMIVSDLDHTMVDHHDPANVSLLRFNALWAADYFHDSMLVYSTGRSPSLYKALRAQKPMLTPDIVIMSVGTEIMYGHSMTPDQGWERELDSGWNRDIVVSEASKFSQLQFQVDTEQRPHKVSFHIDKTRAPEIIKTLNEKLLHHGLSVKLIYSGGADLDILPKGAGKGEALAYLLHKFKSEGRSPLNTLVCGDSGNDIELFCVPDVYGVLVGNAQEELLQWYTQNGKENPRIFHASQKCAAGVIEALHHFDLQPYESPRDASNLLDMQQKRKELSMIGHLVVEFHLLLERWEKAEVDSSDAILQQLKGAVAPNCTQILPWGVEVNLYEGIEALRSRYGYHKNKQLSIWIDRIRTTKLGNGKWMVKFNKWQQTAEEVTCQITTSILQVQDDESDKVCWMHIHETWLDGYAGSRKDRS